MPPCERRRSTGQDSLLPTSAFVVPATAVGLPAPQQQQRRASNDAETRNLIVDLKLQLADALQKVDELTQANKRLMKERDEARNEVALLKTQHEAHPCTCTKEGPTAVAGGDGTKSPVSATSRSDTTRGKFDPSLGYGSSNIRGPSTTLTAGPLEALGGAASVSSFFSSLSSLRRESLMTTTSSRTQTSHISHNQNSQSSLLRVKERHGNSKGGSDDDQDGPIWLQKLRSLPCSSTKDLSSRDDSNMVTKNLTGHKHKRERMPRRGSNSAPNLLSMSPSALAHFNESTLNLMALDDMSESMNNIIGKGDPPSDALPSHVAACGNELNAPLSGANNSLVRLTRNNTENDVKKFFRRMSGLSDDFSLSDDDSFGGDYKNAEWTELP